MLENTLGSREMGGNLIIMCQFLDKNANPFLI